MVYDREIASNIGESVGFESANTGRLNTSEYTSKTN